MPKSFLQFISEAKQVGVIYHLLNLEKMMFVLKTNSLRTKNFSGISTTRSKHLKDYLGSGATPIFKLVLDGDKLSTKYKIEPFKYASVTNAEFSEFEELIKTKEVSNLSNYIISIEIDEKQLKKFKSYFDPSDEWDQTELANLEDTLENLPKLGKVVYV